jgi:hypothetical protein
MHFEIFIPDAAGSTARAFESVGLPHLAAGADGFQMQVGDQTGKLYAWLTPDRPRMRGADWPQWIPAAAHGDLPCGRYLVGIDPDDPCRPSELLLPNAFAAGSYVELGDGNQWLIPHVDELPADMVLRDDGSIQYVRQRQYVAFGHEADRWRQQIIDNDLTGDDVDLYWFAYHALRLNYRLTPEVITALRLLNNQNLQRPVLAVLGGYVLREQQRGA